MTIPEGSIAKAMQETHREEQKAKEAKSNLVYFPMRLLPEDDAMLADLAQRYARSKGYLARVAVHMFCEAQRQNPRAMG